VSLFFIDGSLKASSSLVSYEILKIVGIVLNGKGCAIARVFEFKGYVNLRVCCVCSELCSIVFLLALLEIN